MTPDSRNSEPLDTILRRSMRAQVGPATPECAGAESLAAYSDRSMAAAERERLETHFADCMRCQLLLADIARAEQGARDAKLASEVPWYRRWRIASPALAGVAAILVFIALRRPANEQLRHGEVVAMAKREAPAMELAERAAAPAAPAEAPQVVAHPSPALAPSPPAAAPASNEIAMNESRPREEAHPEAPRLHHAAPAPAAVVAQAPPAAASAPLSVEAGHVVAIAPAAPIVESSPAAVGQPAPLSGLAMNQLHHEAAQRAESMSGGMALQGMERHAPLPGARAMVAQSELPAAKSGAMRTFSAAVADSATGGGAAGGGVPVAILSPDRSIAWQVGENGFVQRHDPDGANHVQHSGVTTNLVAGAAPSATVCWIVGRSGTIIRTTDGGEHWERITAPISDNLTRVSASSAKNATITTERGQSFATSDGGASWHSS